MLYDVRTSDLRPHTVPEAERRLAAACADALADGELRASFHTEIGELSRVIQVWAFDEPARERVRGAATASLAALGELVVETRSEVIVPFAFAPPPTPGAHGPYFELRRYRYAPGELPKIAGAWEAALPGRLRLGSPLILVGGAEEAGADTLLHLWAYRTLDERSALRTEVRRLGIWPPLDVARARGLPVFELTRMENSILVPADFSPIR